MSKPLWPFSKEEVKTINEKMNVASHESICKQLNELYAKKKITTTETVSIKLFSRKD